MRSSLLASQLATLEPLASDEARVVADIRDDPESLVDGIIRQLDVFASRSAAVGAGT